MAPTRHKRDNSCVQGRLEPEALVSPAELSTSGALKSRNLPFGGLGAAPLSARAASLDSGHQHRNALTSPGRTAGMEDDMPSTVLEAYFDCNGVKVRAQSTSNSLSWKPVTSSRSPTFCVNWTALNKRLAYDDILAVRQAPQPRSCQWLGPEEFALVVHAVARRPDQPCQWALEEHTLMAASAEQAQEWGAHIGASLRLCHDRPRNLLVLINPNSGAKRARMVWDQKAQPVFDTAQIKCSLVETLHADHAREVVAQLTAEELNTFQGILAVGGDGVFQECVMGLMAQRAKGGGCAAAAARMRLGHIPGGSTDAVACSLHGTRCAETAALHVALGDRLAIDVARVDSFPSAQEARQGGAAAAAGAAWPTEAGSGGGAPGGRPLDELEAAYGFLGDVMCMSESLRFMGPSRYDFAGLLQLVKLQSYRIKLSYKPCKQPLCADVQHVCSHKCEGGGGSGFGEEVASGGGSSAMQGLLGRTGAYFGWGGAQEMNRCEDPACSPPSSDGWVTTEGDFVSVMVVVTPCRSDMTRRGIVPDGHLADGRLYLILVSKCSRLQYLRFLIHLSSKGLRDGCFPFVRVIPVTGVTVSPLPPGPRTHAADALADTCLPPSASVCEGESAWNVDGELLPHNAVRVGVARGALDVFARGVLLA